MRQQWKRWQGLCYSLCVFVQATTSPVICNVVQQTNDRVGRVRRLYATPASKKVITARSRRGGRLQQDGASPPALEQPAIVRSTARENTKGGRYVMSANAVAGAIAGTLVSICLHPVDTVKVAIQAECSAREPIAKVIARMMSKRGVFGLYSGLTTSLASSAPISAIYTASYESVKGKLLPMFPEVRGVSLSSLTTCTLERVRVSSLVVLFHPSQKKHMV